jgi:hypothetical protein
MGSEILGKILFIVLISGWSYWMVLINGNLYHRRRRNRLVVKIMKQITLCPRSGEEDEKWRPVSLLKKAMPKNVDFCEYSAYRIWDLASYFNAVSGKDAMIFTVLLQEYYLIEFSFKKENKSMVVHIILYLVNKTDADWFFLDDMYGKERLLVLIKKEK